MEDMLFVEEVVMDEVTDEDATMDEELVLLTSRLPPTHLRHLQTVPVSSHCDAVCHYKGNTYVGLFNHDVDKIDRNFNLVSSYLTHNSLVFSICVHHDRIYSLLFGNPYVVNVHDINSGELITSWNHSDGAYSNNKLIVVDNKVIIPDRRHKLLTVYELSGELIKNIPCPMLGSGYIAICKADGDSVIVSDSVNLRLFRIDLTTGEEVWACSNLDTIPHAVACDEYQYVYVTGYASNRIKILDICTELQHDVIREHRGVYDLCLFGDVLVAPAYDMQRVSFFKLEF